MVTRSGICIGKAAEGTDLPKTGSFVLVFILILVVGLLCWLVEENRVWFEEVETAGNHLGTTLTRAALES